MRARESPSSGGAAGCRDVSNTKTDWTALGETEPWLLSSTIPDRRSSASSGSSGGGDDANDSDDADDEHNADDEAELDFWRKLARGGPNAVSEGWSEKDFARLHLKTLPEDYLLGEARRGVSIVLTGNMLARNFEAPSRLCPRPSKHGGERGYMSNGPMSHRMGAACCWSTCRCAIRSRVISRMRVLSKMLESAAVRRHAASHADPNFSLNFRCLSHPEFARVVSSGGRATIRELWILCARYFRTRDTDYAEPLLTWFVHKVPNVTARELESIGLSKVAASTVER